MAIRRDERKLFKAGNSVVLSIPPDFLEINDLGRGDHVEVAWLDTVMRVVPMVSSEKRNEIKCKEDKLSERIKER